MRGSHKSKKVSWASDVNLCQVKLFLLEESPSQVGSSAQDHLQAKASWLSHSSGTGLDDTLPPGFEGGYSENQLQINVTQIPLIKWRCPPKVVLNFAWQVVSGEESKEVEIQNKREIRVLEAVYPRPSAIPQNPSVLADVEDSGHNDGQPLVIPITPIEDEDAGVDTSSSSSLVPFNIPTSSESSAAPSQSSVLNNGNHPTLNKLAPGNPVGAEPDVVAAAFGAIMNSNEVGNMIDQELLIKILSNPKMIEKLVTDPQTMTRPPPQLGIADPPNHSNRMGSSTPLSAPVSSGHFYPQPNVSGIGRFPDARPPLSAAIPVPTQPSIGGPPKDTNYFKNLIQQHGEDRSVMNQVSSNGYKPRDSKYKIMKPCMYFNTPRGCRHGANCAYQHDASFQPRGSSVPEVHSAKRMKMDREISS